MSLPKHDGGRIPSSLHNNNVNIILHAWPRFKTPHHQMASVDTRGVDSDGNGSLTPSEQSENEERSEHDSDYESDEVHDHLEPKRKTLNVQWTGYGKRVPIILFNAETILNKRTDFKTVGERYHLAFKFASTDCKIVRNILLSHGFHEVHPNSVDYNLVWSNSHLKPFTLRTMSEFQKINHFPRSYELTRKDRLFKNIQRMQQIKGFKHFDFIPPSYVLPGDYQDFCSSFLKDKGPYIVKPVASSRGRGVFLINHPDQVPLDENVIVSKYISSPLVIDGFKFDVRLYVTVTSYDPLVIYLYEEGLTRFATVKYEKNVKHLRNQCMHLTNYSVNKRSQDYVKNDDPEVEDYGNKWSMGAMLRYLRSEGKDTAALMMRIEDVVIKTILSVESSVATACKMFQSFRGNCFELYGFDILLDENLKPWVLEVNLSPSLACDSPLDLKIKTNMLCDLFSLAGIICHDPMMRTRQQQNKQTAELSAKLKSRLKGDIDEALAEMLNQIEAARQNMKEADAWLLKRSFRPSSAASSASKDRMSHSMMTGLSSDEIKIVRRVKEEEERKGGWIRIFPTADSWETYGSFLQFPTTHNLMLHQRLYGERHGTGSRLSCILSPLKSKSGVQMQLNGKAENERFLESYTQALLRAKQYESRLGQMKSKTKKVKKKVQKSKPKRVKLTQGVQENEEHVEQEDEGGNYKERDQKSDIKSESKGDKHEVKENFIKNSSYDKEDEKAGDNSDKDRGDKATSEHISPQVSMSPIPKYDVVGLLEKGLPLSKVQARTAFAMYLIRVQQRLLSDCGSVLKQEDVEALNEQMDLVLRFLKRAAANIPQTFRVVVPSRKLPLSDRRRILAKQLGDFVHIYNKETDHLKAVKVRNRIENKKARRVDSSEGLDEIKFDQFVYTATEGELEELLTTYTKINKSAAIFLGGESKSSMSSSEAKKDILSRRRENPDLADGLSPVGLTGQAISDDISRGRHGNFNATNLNINSNNILFHICSQASATDTYAGKVMRTPPRPYSAQNQNSHLSTVSIYSQKLGRPYSAARVGSAHRSGNAGGYQNNPATNGPPPSSSQSSNTMLSTSNPVVDTYNEKAIQEALQRLALRQQARQYAAPNGSTVFKPENEPYKLYYASGLEGQMNQVKSLSGQTLKQYTSSSNQLYSQGSSVQHIPHEENSLKSISQTSIGSFESRPSSFSAKSRPTVLSSTHARGANATFNSFIDDPDSQSNSDFIAPSRPGTAKSRQAQQQVMKQELLEQSKQSSASSMSRSDSKGSLSSLGSSTKTYLPQPPSEQSRSFRTQSHHRVNRKPDETDSNLHLNFYNSLVAMESGTQS
ncbi:tubulin polyglutamylase TTLL5-like isoform X6 [Biomphalaria glabrata]|uniref:Tubulin--tyrosine ligase-like protein 5 n=1 Tax=Biomphalaria glabrata TaxID=6526 RepID=A0A9W2ZXS7_BIOGL|nr:tubulin polyglutamylase TTLL5-like isoform X6 [Biomphalaria glabrata]